MRLAVGSQEKKKRPLGKGKDQGATKNDRRNLGVTLACPSQIAVRGGQKKKTQRKQDARTITKGKELMSVEGREGTRPAGKNAVGNKRNSDPGAVKNHSCLRQRQDLGT